MEVFPASVCSTQLTFSCMELHRWLTFDCGPYPSPHRELLRDGPEYHRSRMSKRHLQPVCTPQLPAKASFNGYYSAETTMARHEGWVPAQRYLFTAQLYRKPPVWRYEQDPAMTLSLLFWLRVTVVDAASLSTGCLPVHPLYGCQSLLFIRTRPHWVQVKSSCSSEQDDSSLP